jgi:ATP-dependent DNA helicase RecQ
MIKAHRTDMQSFFGCGAGFEEKYWMALLRQVLVSGYLSKDIETYGILKITQKGLDYIKSPHSFMMSEDH